jgi:hypothetical protein
MPTNKGFLVLDNHRTLQQSFKFRRKYTSFERGGQFPLVGGCFAIVFDPTLATERQNGVTWNDIGTDVAKSRISPFL